MPLWYLLIVFGGVLAIAGLFVFFNLFHIQRFGLAGVGSTLVSAAYVISFLGTLLICLALLSPYDWSGTLDLPALLRTSISTDSIDNL